MFSETAIAGRPGLYTVSQPNQFPFPIRCAPLDNRAITSSCSTMLAALLALLQGAGLCSHSSINKEFLRRAGRIMPCSGAAPILCCPGGLGTLLSRPREVSHSSLFMGSSTRFCFEIMPQREGLGMGSLPKELWSSDGAGLGDAWRAQVVRQEKEQQEAVSATCALSAEAGCRVWSGTAPKSLSFSKLLVSRPPPPPQHSK